ncbi:hypothetical protein SAMN05444920_12260 [Nonomuraea solani]|uniref:Uncharacterized protein n=1 Tax=Nonomuraea solani TaxID=1144553 RepID=A0A1H6EY56_9ACTN|nr:hypothetical protein SAMN05444920_12260 [Nonomuraea solani]
MSRPVPGFTDVGLRDTPIPTLISNGHQEPPVHLTKEA